MQLLSGWRVFPLIFWLANCTMLVCIRILDGFRFSSFRQEKLKLLGFDVYLLWDHLTFRKISSGCPLCSNCLELSGSLKQEVCTK
jgi:hypothetical protein